MPGLGVAVGLRPLAPGDGAEEPRLALPRRAAQPAPLPRVLAPEPVDLRVPGRIPMFIPPNSVTIRHFSAPRVSKNALTTARLSKNFGSWAQIGIGPHLTSGEVLGSASGVNA